MVFTFQMSMDFMNPAIMINGTNLHGIRSAVCRTCITAMTSARYKGSSVIDLTDVWMVEMLISQVSGIAARWHRKIVVHAPRCAINRILEEKKIIIF